MDRNSDHFSKVPMVWKPNENTGKQTRKFIKRIEEKYGKKFNGFWDFHKWSVDHIPEFWEEIWEVSGILYSKKYQKVIDMSMPMTKPPLWFEGAYLNYAENLLKYKDDHVALISTGEDGETSRTTYAELYEETKLYAAAFRKFGVQKGDIIMCFMSNRKEAILGMLAAVSIGAMWTGALPQMGHQAVLNRMSQVNPKLLLTVDRFRFNKEEIEMLPKLVEVAKGLPSVEKVIIVPSKEDSKKNDISDIRNSCWIDEFLALGRNEDGSVPPIQFEQLPFDYPVFLHFTSGTTGLPKALTHGAGFLLIVYADYVIHMDTTRDDVHLSFSPVGWASWTIYTTLLFCGVTVILHEGSPFLLSPTYIWDMVDEFKISYLLFTSTVVDELQKRKYVPTKNHNLSSLKLIMAGGSPVKLRSYDFIYNDLKLDVMFAGVYGCTEVMGLILLDFTHPVYKGELSIFTFGIKIECLNDKGEPVEGEVGELVIATPSPGMVQSIWNDDDGSKIHEKYFSKYPGKFLIGDFGYINPVTRGLVVCGRCDDTLKQRGCRFGSSEIYNVVDHFTEVHDSLCVSQYNKDMEERAVLFLKMKKGCNFNNDLVKRIRERIAHDLTPRHVPDVIIETGEIPFNTNGKKMEIQIKKIINNMPCNNDAIANPDCLKFYVNRPELQGDF